MILTKYCLPFLAIVQYCHRRSSHVLSDCRATKPSEFKNVCGGKRVRCVSFPPTLTTHPLPVSTSLENARIRHRTRGWFGAFAFSSSRKTCGSRSRHYEERHGKWLPWQVVCGVYKSRHASWRTLKRTRGECAKQRKSSRRVSHGGHTRRLFNSERLLSCGWGTLLVSRGLTASRVGSLSAHSADLRRCSRAIL